MKPQKSPLIFIVEDDKIYSELVLNELKSNNYTNVKTFDNGNDCLDNLYQMPEIILLDYNLGDENGLDILRQIKGFSPDIHVIFLSAQENMEVAINTLKYGAFDYITKSNEALKRVTITLKKITVMNEKITWVNQQKGLMRMVLGIFVGLQIIIFALLYFIGYFG